MRSPLAPVQSSTPPVRRRRLGPVCASVAVVALSVAMVACSDSGVGETPTPGGTLSPTGTVRAPNGTNMGAPPLNGGTVAGG